MSDKVVFTDSDFYHFRGWLELNDRSLTWQGKYEKEFETFWRKLFLPGLKLSQVSFRFQSIIAKSKVGPLSTWFIWLRNKFICYTFIRKDVTIKRISSEFHIAESEIGIILKDFFTKVFPEERVLLESNLLITSKINPNREITYQRLMSSISKDVVFTGSHEEILTGMEVTLYEEWAKLSDFLDKLDHQKSDKFVALKSKESLIDVAENITRIIATICVGVFLVWTIKYLNVRYEQILSEEVSIYEPQYRWEDKGLKFVEADKSILADVENFNLDIEDIENVDDTENYLGESLEDTERITVESETVLSSIESLPKDFDSVSIEQSEYEEDTGRLGYRDSRYGNTKVYRVMMKSSDTTRARGLLSKLIQDYKVKQVDNVKPGLEVPGGFYYNLYVPRELLREFMAKVKEVDVSVIYESRTRTRRNPPGKNKVFIWIKSI